MRLLLESDPSIPQETRRAISRGDDDARTLRGEPLRHAESDATIATRNDGDLVLQVEHR